MDNFNQNDIDPIETKEWLDAIDSVIENEGPKRAHHLLKALVKHAREAGIYLPFSATTSYVNTIPAGKGKPIPGNQALEHKIRSIIRWNAAMIVLRASKKGLELGGHIASFQSAATLYEVGFNHFWKAQNDKQLGDLLFLQGHSSPGFYARAFLEGRLTEKQLDNFRQEIHSNGLSSYPHPWLMPNFWQFPTVSMGLGPIMGIYQARLLKYLESRHLVPDQNRKVWVFCGDGEMDEPESQGAISLAARYGLDNLIFVVNCNLQRLDGPVRGNGKIIQELEGNFRGAGWNVIKVIWGSRWDGLLAKDNNNLLKKRMEECVDGDYQTYKSKNGSYVREHFFGAYPELLDMVADMSDEDIWHLNRGGHDPHKVYAAYYEACHHSNGRPTVILAKTIKGYGMGLAGEGQNTAHQTKKMDLDSLKQFRDRFNIPISDQEIENNLPYYKPTNDSPEIQYLLEKRATLGGFLPKREPSQEKLPIPDLTAFDSLLKDSEDRQFSTTMAFVRILSILLKNKQIGERIVPIVPDESRTFGMEGMFRQYGIWNPQGQIYTPPDANELMFYKESKDGQIFEEGITESGAMSSWIAAATSYANNQYPLIPFYIYYSIFGFQRMGDLAWAAGDLRARGFLLGGTAGRTTLNGEGLQHEDGHSQIQADLIPNCISYDPAFAYELAVIVHDGLKRMYINQEDIFYYITVMNENYHHPGLPNKTGIEDQILKGMYCLIDNKAREDNTVQLLGSGTILNEVIAASRLLKEHFNVNSNVWSVTSFNQLYRDAIKIERYNRLHPKETAKIPYLVEKLDGYQGPVIAATDYVREYANKIKGFLPNTYTALGTDGFGRSDSRENLRKFFEVSREYIVLTALYELAKQNKIDKQLIEEAISKYNINIKNISSWEM